VRTWRRIPWGKKLTRMSPKSKHHRFWSRKKRGASIFGNKNFLLKEGRNHDDEVQCMWGGVHNRCCRKTTTPRSVREKTCSLRSTHQEIWGRTETESDEKVLLRNCTIIQDVWRGKSPAPTKKGERESERRATQTAGGQIVEEDVCSEPIVQIERTDP